MNRKDNWLWISVGLAGLGLTATTVLIYRHYQLERRRVREARDPRAQQVRALIQEAEKLITLGRKGAAGS